MKRQHRCWVRQGLNIVRSTKELVYVKLFILCLDNDNQSMLVGCYMGGTTSIDREVRKGRPW